MLSKQAVALKTMFKSQWAIVNKVFGVETKIIPAKSLDEAFDGWGDVEYDKDNVFYKGKTIIPQLIVKRGRNPFTWLDISLEVIEMWSQIQFPKYSLVQIPEEYNYEELRITGIQETQETSQDWIYYKYILTPVSKLHLLASEINNNSSFEDEFIADPDFAIAIEESNKKEHDLDQLRNYNKL